MRKGRAITFAIFGLVVLLVVISFSSYNSLVGMNESADSQWVSVESVYQKRTDLVVDLINTVKMFADLEATVLNEVEEAERNVKDNLSSDKIKELEVANMQLTVALLNLYIEVARYPDLSAKITPFKDELAVIDEQTVAECEKFNEKTGAYNAYIKAFPSSIYANLFGFEAKGGFKAM